MTTLIPTVTVAQMREVDRVMVDEMGIELIQMMENAGRCLAQHARTMLGGDARNRRIMVLAGSGGNGGGGLAAARRLAIWGAEVEVALSSPTDKLSDVTGRQLGILQRMEVLVRPPHAFDASAPERADLVIDALIGYGLVHRPRDPVPQMIVTANTSGAPILALDVPTGLDADTGRPLGDAIRARATLTLALPKAGLIARVARDWVGDLFLADISVPAAVYRRLGIDVEPLFAGADIIKVGEA